MKAMAITEFGKDLELLTFEDPIPGPGEVIVDVLACGICQTDLKIVAGTHPSSKKVKLPFVPGHEIVGRVAVIGEGVEGLAIGDQVIVYFYVGCGCCKYCQEERVPLCTGFRTGKAFTLGFSRFGGYGEKVKVPATNLIRISDSVPPEEAAIIPDAISTAVHAVVNRADVQEGDRVMIFGAGGVGLHAMQIAKICRAHVMVADVDEGKLSLATELGADEVFLCGQDDPGKLNFNKLIETSGVLSSNMWAMDYLEPGGCAVIVGNKIGAVLQPKVMDITSKELEIKGSRASSIKDVQIAADMVERGLIKAIVGTKYRFEDVNQALQDLKAGKINGRGVLVRE